MGQFIPLGNFPNDASQVGVFLVLMRETNQFHAGFLVKRSGEQPQQFHLLFHHRLLIEGFDPGRDYFWATPGCAEDQFNQTILMAKIIQYQRNASAIGSPVPFGLRYDDLAFEKDGQYISRPPGRGLSCATFLLAVFERLGYVPLDKATWSESEPLDIVWQTHILTQLADPKHGASEAHLEAAKSEIGCKRYRPAQVVNAIAADQKLWPLDWITCKALAEKMVKNKFGKSASKIC